MTCLCGKIKRTYRFATCPQCNSHSPPTAKEQQAFEIGMHQQSIRVALNELKKLGAEVELVEFLGHRTSQVLDLERRGLTGDLAREISED